MKTSKVDEMTRKEMIKVMLDKQIESNCINKEDYNYLLKMYLKVSSYSECVKMYNAFK